MSRAIGDPDDGEDRDGDADALADWVAELVERLEAGEPVDLTALGETHPEQAEELRRMLPTIRRMASFGRAVAGSSGRTGGPGRSRPEAELGRLGDFRLLREVGRGGMGVVYEAEQISLGRRVALKVLPLAAALDHRHHQRFLLEARAAACLHHAHIVPVHAVGSERGVPYYAMQFIDGRTLAQVLDQLRGGNRGTVASAVATTESAGPAAGECPSQSPIPETGPWLGTSWHDRHYPRAVAEHGRRAAEALDHAHGRGILHRDIKPANLMIDVEGHLWIADFGLAQIQGDSRLTLTGDIVGTLRYMSPEQALGRRVVVDGRTDLYSLGATLYELITLRPVFEGSDRSEILRRIAQDEPTPIRKLNPAVPRDMETIVHKALAKEPSDRYATAREMADDLGRFLDGRSIAARPPGRGERLARWARRNRSVVTPAAIFAVLALIAMGGALAWSNNWHRHHGEQLQVERDRAEGLSRELEAQRDLAEHRRQVADRHLHAFRLRQADEARQAGQIEKAQVILRDAIPEPGEDDLREFAWYYLWRESRKHLAVLSERTERVGSLALSPDGRTLATGDRDGTIRLRDPETGRVAMTLRGREFGAGFLAFSPDGHRLASAGSQNVPPPLRGELLLWEIDSGRLLARLEGFSDRSVEQIAFDARGERLWEISGTARGPWRLGCWDLKTDPARPRLTWSRHYEDARPPRSGDGPIAAFEGPGPGFRLHDLACALRLGWAGSIEIGQLAAGSADGRLLAIGAGPWNILWDVEADRERARYPNQHVQGINTIQFSPDNRYVTVEFNADDRCEIYDLRTGAVRVIPPAVVDPPRTRPQAFSPDGRFFARSVSRQGSPQPARVWQLDPWCEVAAFPGVLGIVDSLLFARDGRSLIVCVSSNAVRWNFLPPQEQGQPDGHKDEAWATAFSSDGRLLATGSDDTDDPQTLKIWDAASGRLVRGWKPHDATTGAIAFQPGGRILATAGLSPDANLRLWDAATGVLVATLDGHTDKVRTLAFSPDGRRLASAGSDRTIRIWDVAAQRCVRTLAGHTDTIRQVAFGPDGRLLASVGADATVRFWDADGVEPAWVWEGSVKIAAVAFSPDGRTIAWAHEDGVIVELDMAKKRLLPAMHSEHEQLRCLAFSPDGHTLAAGGMSGTIRLWDPISRQELLEIAGRPCQVNGLAFAPDGSALAACWHDGTVRIFRAR